MSSEAMLMTAIGVMATVVTALSGAVVALWRIQMKANERCERERANCEKEQKRLWDAIVELTGKSCTLQDCGLRAPVRDQKKPPNNPGHGGNFTPAPTN